MIIGLTGPNASGKGEVAKYLASKGYKIYSLSDVLREEAKKFGLDQSRETLTEFGNQLRKKYGVGILVKKILGKIRREKKIVVDSIRNPGEIRELRKLNCSTGKSNNRKSVFILGIDAQFKLRYQRLLKRKRLGDIKTITEFIENEKKENVPNRYNQQLNHCLELADKIIINDSSLDELYTKVSKIIQRLNEQNTKTKLG